MFKVLKLALFAATALVPVAAHAETDARTLTVLKGLAPVAALPSTSAGRAALGANYSVTGAIQSGALGQSTLLPFAEQQQQALKDAWITDGDLADLADGLGSTLGAAYVAKAHYLDRERFTNLSPELADFIAYTNSTTGADSNAGKYLFANATTNGKAAVAADLASVVKDNGATTDVFGTSYGRPAGSPGADAFGDSRPFQTLPSIVTIIGPDYFNVPSDNIAYNKGPMMNLTDSPSYPSGHTTYGYMGSLVLAELVPERFPEMIARGAEYGNDRILMGAHYAMDVLAGRTLSTYDLAHLLANDPAYLNRTLRNAQPITDYAATLKGLRPAVEAALAAACGDAVAACASADIGRFNNPIRNEAFYATTQTYGLPVVYPERADKVEDVGTLAKEAGYLLTAAYPSLTLDQANQILTETEGPGGGFLDNGSEFGVYSRLNLFAAASRARQMSAGK